MKVTFTANRQYKRKDGRARIGVWRLEDGTTLIQARVLGDRKTRRIERGELLLTELGMAQVIQAYAECKQEAQDKGAK